MTTPINMTEEIQDDRCKVTEQCLNDAFCHLIKELPPGWEIHFVARRDEAEMELVDPNGIEVSTQWDGDSHSIKHFLDVAKGVGKVVGTTR